MKALYLLPLTYYLLLPYPALARALLVLTPTHRTNDLGNPIYTLNGYANGTKKLAVDTVTGTSRSQKRDRQTPNIYAPLPDGGYDLGTIEPGIGSDVGETFIRLRPRFKTRRTNLGIHWDVSANRRNGRDGTAGCIGTLSQKDMSRVRRFVRKYRPIALRVRIFVRSI